MNNSVPIAFHCPRCQAPLTVPDGEAGSKLRCPKCHGKLRVPLPGVPSSGSLIEFRCPRCEAPVTVPAERAGQKQLCPKCRGKLRVPLPAETASGAAIEFLCPRCQAVMHARADEAGTKRACPECGGRVAVPVPVSARGDQEAARAPVIQRPAVPAIISPAHLVPNGESGAEAAGVTTSDGREADEDEQVPVGIPASAVARRSNLAALVLPLACLGVLAAIAAWLLHKPEPKLEGTLKGERVTDNDFGPFRVDKSFLGVPLPDVRPLLENLESEPIRAVSPILILEFQGSPGGINVFIRAGDRSEFYRVDPRQDRSLAKYLEREKERLETARISELTRSVPAFLKALQDRPEGERDLTGLAEFRNSVGLASITRGFAHHVQAVIGRQAYPCVHEDTDGRLYFSLPVETQEFEITGRDSTGRDSTGRDSTGRDSTGRDDTGKASGVDPPFPGRYQVVVAGEPVTLNTEVPDPKKKIRKLLRE